MGSRSSDRAEAERDTITRQDRRRQETSVAAAGVQPRGEALLLECSKHGGRGREREMGGLVVGEGGGEVQER